MGAPLTTTQEQRATAKMKLQNTRTAPTAGPNRVGKQTPAPIGPHQNRMWRMLRGKSGTKTNPAKRKGTSWEENSPQVPQADPSGRTWPVVLGAEDPGQELGGWGPLYVYPFVVFKEELVTEGHSFGCFSHFLFFFLIKKTLFSTILKFLIKI